MAGSDVVGSAVRHHSILSTLDADSAGELLTLQRAAYVTEAIAHPDLGLPPLTESLEALFGVLLMPNVRALGVRDVGRLIGAVRLRSVGTVIELGRLAVAPDRQGQGVGSFLLQQAESAFPGAEEIRLFSGEFSERNIRMYLRHGYAETKRTPAGDYALVHFAKALV